MITKTAFEDLAGRCYEAMYGCPLEPRMQWNPMKVDSHAFELLDWVCQKMGLSYSIKMDRHLSLVIFSCELWGDAGVVAMEYLDTPDGRRESIVKACSRVLGIGVD